MPPRTRSARKKTTALRKSFRLPQLPTELLVQLIRMLPPSEILAVRAAGAAWRALAASEEVLGEWSCVGGVRALPPRLLSSPPPARPQHPHVHVPPSTYAVALAHVASRPPPPPVDNEIIDDASYQMFTLPFGLQHCLQHCQNVNDEEEQEDMLVARADVFGRGICKLVYSFRDDGTISDDVFGRVLARLPELKVLAMEAMWFDTSSTTGERQFRQ